MSRAAKDENHKVKTKPKEDMNTSKAKNFFVTTLFMNVVLAASYGFLIYSTSKIQKETTELYTASHQRESDQERIQALKQALKETEVDRAKIDEYFIQKADTVMFIEHIEKIGKDAGVVLSVNSVTDAPKGSIGVQLDFSAVGEFSNIYQLVALIESMPHKIIFKKTDIQKTETDGLWKGVFTITLESFLSANTPDSTLAAAGDKNKK